MRVLFVLAVLSSSLSLAAPRWSLDASHSELVVKVWKTGAAAGLAHDHAIRAGRVSGTASLDEAGSPESLALDLEVEVAALVADEPEVRKRHGVEGGPVPDGDRQKVREHMLGGEQLEATKFPVIKFVSSKLTREASGALRCAGTLTLHGVSRELQFTVTNVKASAKSFEGEATVKLKTSDFGVKPYSTALGLIQNRDEVELIVHLVLTQG